MARLNIKWQSLSSVAPAAVTTGETEEASEEATKQAMFADKPLMIYVTSDDPTDSDTRKLESVVFANEKVGVGAKFFDAVKMTAGDAAQDRLLKDAGRKLPRIVFVNRDYSVADVLEGSELSGGKLLRAMQSVVRRAYVNSFDSMVRNYIKLLNELDRLESKKAAIEDQKRRVAAKPNKSREKKIARDEAEYKEDMEAWEKKEQKILELKIKGGDAAA